MSGNASRSWVDGANEPHGFGVTHLPYGAYRQAERGWLCVRIGDYLLNLADCVAGGLLNDLAAEVREACSGESLNALLGKGPAAWAALRARLGELLGETANGQLRQQVAECLQPMSGADLVLPVEIGDYTDFYASLHHAQRVGEIFRPDNPLLPNYKHVPIGYHGRASSIVVSGSAITRPWGQSRPAEGESVPGFGPSTALDYEAELAFLVGTGNALGEPVPVDQARGCIFGVALLNDWSARDIQAWEYQPLGPFLGKNFATSLSPWVTPLAALEPFRVPAAIRGAGDPAPLPYLLSAADQTGGGLDIRISVSLSTGASRAAGMAPMEISSSSTRDLYWTVAQMVAHHTSNGCNLRAGDTLATGTVSGPARATAGCLMELTRNGTEPLELANGERRLWLEDGDEVLLTGMCVMDGVAVVRIGSCSGRIGAAAPARR